MEFFFGFVGFMVCCLAISSAIIGVTFGIIAIYDYFVRLQDTVNRIENLIKAEDYTGAEGINHE